MSDLISSLIERLLALINPLKPRFYISASTTRCRERVQRAGSGTPLIMIRAKVENFGWEQTAPPPCEVHLVKTRRNDWPIEKDDSRLKWTDVDSFDGQKIIRSNLIDVCSVDKNEKPTLVVESEKGRKGYGFFRDAGVYKFDLVTVCKGSSPGRATITVSFDGIHWENVHIVSVESRAKWRHWVWDCVALLILLSLASAYFVLDSGKAPDSVQAVAFDPVIDLSLGEPFGSSTVVTLKNSGVGPITDVAANLRCFVLPIKNDISPMLFFEGFRSISNKNSWWLIDRIAPGNTVTKDAKESLERCLHNSQLTEQSPMQFSIAKTVLAIDVTYRREIDKKEYKTSAIAELMKDSRTGQPFLWPTPMTEYYRHMLETVTAPNFFTEPR